MKQYESDECRIHQSLRLWLSQGFSFLNSGKKWRELLLSAGGLWRSKSEGKKLRNNQQNENVLVEPSASATVSSSQERRNRKHFRRSSRIRLRNLARQISRCDTCNPNSLKVKKKESKTKKNNPKEGKKVRQVVEQVSTDLGKSARRPRPKRSIGTSAKKKKFSSLYYLPDIVAVE